MSEIDPAFLQLLFLPYCFLPFRFLELVEVQKET